MSSTFYGLNIGASALNAYSASINTTANNVSNANTEGYSRQVTNLQAKGALRNYNYGTLGSGVTAESITQLRNNYYDIKYWTNNSYSGQYEKKMYYTAQIENLFKDFDTTKGFTTIFNGMFRSLESLKGNSGDVNIRNQFINNTQSLMEYFNNVNANLQDMQSDCNQEVRALVSEINSTAKKISVLNDKINTLEIQGTYANELRDQRALLIDHLSEIVPVETEEIEIQNSNYPDMYTGATNFRIRVGGQMLVDGESYNELEVYTREAKVNQNDIDGLYEIRWAKTKNEFNGAAVTMSGQLKAVLDVRDGNNNENFQGTLAAVDKNKITIENVNITSIEGMNMPDAGRITVGNRSYSYSEFQATIKTAADGTQTATYEFTLSDNDLTTLAGGVGRPVSIGTPVDSRGIPYYLSQMNEFLRSFCKQLNDIQLKGVDMYGNPMGTYLIGNYADGTENTFADAEGTANADGSVTYKSTEENYFFMTAANVAVNDKSLRDANYLATSSKSDTHESKAELVEEMLQLQDKTVVYRGSGANEFLQYITSDITVDAEEAEILYTNYASVGETINSYRMSVSSVDEDEEGLDLVKFQNAYNMASKVISTMNQMFDRLITQTGV